MDAWVWIVLIVAVLVVAGLVWFTMSRSRQQEAARQAKAQAHRDEADLRASRALQEQAAAEEQAARARRERAEVDERSALAEREARDRLAAAEAERAEADALYRRADELSPGDSVPSADPVDEPPMTRPTS